MDRDRRHTFSGGAYGAAIKVKVTPHGVRNEITGMDMGVLNVLITGDADNEDGNAMVVKLLSAALGVNEKNVDIVAGERSNQKLVSVIGINPNDVNDMLTS